MKIIGINDDNQKKILSAEVGNIARVGGQSNLYNYIRKLPNLIAYYPLGELSGNAINKAPATLGTLDGTVTGATQGAAGLIGKAYGFDASGEKVVGDSSSIWGAGDWSFIALIYQTGFGGGNAGRIVNHTSGSNGVLILNSGTSTQIQVQINGSARLTTDIGSLSLNVWQMITIVYDGTNVTFYKNGTQIKQAAYSTAVTAPGNALHIGAAHFSTERYWQGSFQHFGFVQRELTATEILNLAEIAGLA